MSPNVGNFVHDLVEMAKAMEELPSVKQALAEALAEAEAQRQHVADRELRIIELKQALDNEASRSLALEVERDEAKFRVLELEDTAHHTAIALRDTIADATRLLALVDPPKPDPVPAPGTSVVETVAQPTAEVTIPHGAGAGAWSGDGGPRPSDHFDPGHGSDPVPEVAQPAPTPIEAPHSTTTTSLGMALVESSASDPALVADPAPDRYGDGSGNHHQPDKNATHAWWDWYNRQTREVQASQWND